ncbi:MAG: hypothetical protein GWN66_14430, partial [Pseudomonas stutzeri]|nr:hypothetical protein [Stutzerimonas stutzeri]
MRRFAAVRTRCARETCHRLTGSIAGNPLYRYLGMTSPFQKISDVFRPRYNVNFSIE